MNRFTDRIIIYPRKLDPISVAFARMSDLAIRIELENENKTLSSIEDDQK